MAKRHSTVTSAAEPLAAEPAGCLTLNDFCAAYGIGRSMAYILIQAGKLRAVKAGKLTLVRVKDAEAWADSLSVLNL